MTFGPTTPPATDRDPHAARAADLSADLDRFARSLEQALAQLTAADRGAPDRPRDDPRPGGG